MSGLTKLDLHGVQIRGLVAGFEAVLHIHCDPPSLGLIEELAELFQPVTFNHSYAEV